MGIYTVHRAVLPDEFPGSYLPYSLHSRHIVGGVPTDGQHIDYLGRRGNPVTGTDLRRTQDFVLSAGLAWFVLEDAGSDQLAVVLVGSYHIDIETGS